MNKRVLITGGGRGIGFALTRALTVSGYNVDVIVKTERSRLKVQRWAQTVESSVRVFKVDLANAESVVSFTRQWKDELWGLINNAGICKTLPVNHPSRKDPYTEILATNLTSAYLLGRGLLESITRPGRIINIASQLGLDGRAGYGAYCASKFGLIGLTKCWAKELGGEGITVNAVCPGWVSTEMSLSDTKRLALESGISCEEYNKLICAPLELKRFNTPEEVASLVRYLLSDEAAGISGREWLMQTLWNQQ